MEKEVKVILPQVELICGKYRSCCANYIDCEATLKYFPSGSTGFYTCGC